jgi:rRNA maturation protein Rpf1
MHTRVQSRMWFSASDLRTAALERIMNSSRSRLELDMAELFNEIMDAHHTDCISFCMADLIALFEYHHVKMDKAQVKRILKDLWKVPHADNALSYSTYVIDRDNTTGYAEVRRIGRFYTVSHDNISHLL